MSFHGIYCSFRAKLVISKIFSSFFLQVLKKNYNFAIDLTRISHQQRKRQQQNKSNMKFFATYSYYYFYFARNCEAGSCV